MEGKFELELPCDVREGFWCADVGGMPTFSDAVVAVKDSGDANCELPWESSTNLERMLCCSDCGDCHGCWSIEGDWCPTAEDCGDGRLIEGDCWLFKDVGGVKGVMDWMGGSVRLPCECFDGESICGSLLIGGGKGESVGAGSEEWKACSASDSSS